MISLSAVFGELVAGEVDLVDELRSGMDVFVNAFDQASTPHHIRKRKDQLALNLRELTNFHSNVLLKGLQYYADDPGKVGTTFLRLERDFDQHVRFCRDQVEALKVLDEEPDLAAFFDKLREGKNCKPFRDFLCLPLQRIQTYQSLFKELMKYSGRAGAPTEPLEKALELMLSIPQRAADLSYIRAIRGYPGDPGKLARLLRHNDFTLGGDSVHVFLFRTRLLITHTVQPDDPEDFPEFRHSATVRLDRYGVREDGDDLLLEPLDEGEPEFRLRPLQSDSGETPALLRQVWLKDTLESKTHAATTTNLEMQGTRVTRTQYGFRTLQESSAKMCLKVTGYPLPLITWFKDGEELSEESGRHKFYADDDGFFALTIDPVKVEDTGRYACVATNEYGQATTSAFFRVVKVEHEPSAPAFLSQLTDQGIREGETASFGVEVAGWPEPELEWLVDGQTLHPSHDYRIDYDGERATLQIRDAQIDDAGIYSVRIVNELGMKETKAVLNVEEDPDKSKIAPEFQSKLVDVTCDEGDTARFKAVITGDPCPDVTWHVNGVALTPSEFVQFIAEDGIHIMTIKNVTTHFDGEVMCRAINRLGEASSTAQLRVNRKAVDAPVMEEGPSDQMAVEGDEAVFSALVSGEDVDVAWLLDGQPLEDGVGGVRLEKADGGRFRCILGDLKPTQAGELVCRASNEGGQVQAAAQLGVRRKRPSQKPEFQSGLSAINLMEGDTLRAKVLISGDPEPKAKWTIGGKMVVATEDVDMVAEDGVYILTIRGVTADMSGELKCTAYNKMGEVSTAAPLTIVNPVPVEFEQFLADATCREGDTLKLKAVLLGEPAPEVTWYINGKKLEQTSKISISSEKGTYIVVIKDITCDYSGTVECKAVNEYGEASSSATLTVLPRGEPPDFDEWLSNVNVREASPVTHRVVFSGDPTPVLTWYINGKEVFDGKDGIRIITAGKTCTLTIDAFNATHVGEIICKAENEAGEVSCTAQMHMAVDLEEVSVVSEDALAESVGDEIDDGATDTAASIPDEEEFTRTETPVQGPKFITRIKDSKAKKGEKAIFECVVPESKGVVCKWLKDGKEIELVTRIRVSSRASDGTITHTLEIDSLTLQDAGKITAIVSNEAGEDMCSAKLEVTEMAPEVKEGLSDATVTEGQKIALSCVVLGASQDGVQWTKNARKVSSSAKVETSSDGRHTLVIEEASLSDDGEYAVTVHNSGGSKTLKATVKVKKADKAPKFLKEVTSATASVGCSISVSCAVEGVPEPEVAWLIEGRELKASSNITMTSTKEGVHKLDIVSATLAESGTVSAVAKNVAGQAESRATLVVEEVEVLEAPEFVEALTEAEATEGEVVELRCRVTGTPAPSVQWMRDGKELKPSADFTIEEKDGVNVLRINSAKVDLSGQFTCQALNKAGQATTQAPLTVKLAEVVEIPSEEPAPSFVKELNAQTVEEGEAVLLECTIASDVKVTKVEWLKDGTPIPNDAAHITEQRDDGQLSLKILKATAEDVGKYECQIAAKMGTAKTSGSLDVKKAQVAEVAESETAPSFAKELSPHSVEEGEALALECVLAKDVKATQVQWLKDGTPLPADDAHFITEATDDGHLRLKIDKACSEDVGTYSCQVAVKSGLSAKTSAALDVRHAKVEEIAEEAVPVFVQDLGAHSIEEGESIALECALPSEVKITKVTWLKDNKPVNVDGTHIVETRTDDGHLSLKIQKATSEDIGAYTCQVATLTKTAKSEGSLDVKTAQVSEIPEEVAPVFLQELGAHTVEEGETISLDCALPSEVKITNVTWLKDNTPIVADGAHIVETRTDDGHLGLKIEKATTEDVGSYTCQVATLTKTAKSEGSLDVKTAKVSEISEEVAPVFLQDLGAHSIEEGESIALECVLPSEVKIDKVTWLKDNKAINIDGTHITEIQTKDGHLSLKIDKATSEDVGAYTCQVATLTKTAKSEGTLDVKMAKVSEIKEEAAPVFLQDLGAHSIEEGESIALECVLPSEVKVNKVTWLKDSKPVVIDGTHIVETHTDDGHLSLKIDKATSEDVGAYTCQVATLTKTAKSEGSLDVKTATVSEIATETAPEFVTALSSAQAEEGVENLVLECRVKGSPAPEVAWLKDGTPVVPDGHHFITEQLDDGTARLKIDKVSSVDAGVYKAEAVNKVGKAETSAELDIKKATESTADLGDEAPEFCRALEAVAAAEGTEVRMECQVAAVLPGMEVHWMKDGKPITEKVETSSLPDGTQVLCIKSAEKIDVGAYSCEIVTKAGKAATEAKLDVSKGADVAPEFVVVLHSATAVVSEQAVLECRVTGTPTPVVQWLKDGAPLDTTRAGLSVESLDDGTQRLTFSSAALADIGEYRCQAENSAGKAWTEGPLEIKTGTEEVVDGGVAPDFVEPVRSAVATEGEAVVLECRVVGEPKPELRWFKDGVPLEGPVEEGPDGLVRLSLPPTTTADAGEYRCEASNPLGVVWSDATLQIQEAKQVTVVAETVPEFVQKLKAEEVAEGSLVELVCIAKGTPAPKVEILRDGKAISAEPGVKVVSKQLPDGNVELRVKISDASAKDQAKYEAVATNKMGKSVCTAELRIRLAQVVTSDVVSETAPEFLEPLQPVSTDEGAMATMECRVVGVPMPEVKWFKDGAHVRPDAGTLEIESLEDGTQRLHILKTTAEDQGNYKIEAFNSAGTMSTKAPLTVHVAEEDEAPAAKLEAPAFTTPLQPCKANVGGEAALTCVVSGAESVTWFKGDKPITAATPNVSIQSFPDGRQELKIKNCAAEDVGLYRVVAQNAGGSAKSDADVDVVEEKPAFAKGLKAAKAKEGDTVEMACQMKKQKGAQPKVKWYRNGKELVAGPGVEMSEAADGTLTLRLKDVKTSDAGKISVKLVNSAGSAESEAALAVDAAGSGPKILEALKSVAVTEGEAASLVCKVGGEPFPTFTWYKNGQPLKAAQSDVDASGTIKLPFPATTPDDAAHYTLKLSNPHGEAETEADLSVSALIKLKAPEFVVGLEGLQPAEPDTKLTLIVELNTINLKIKWMLNDEEVISGTKGMTTTQISETKFSLTIEKCTTEFFAPSSFACSARNELGAVLTTGQLHKKEVEEEELSFVKKLGDTVGKRGADLVLSVQVKGQPKSVRWYHNGVELESGVGKADIVDGGDGTYSLRIKAAADQDEGVYKVVLENSRGAIESTTEVRSEAPPEADLALKKGLRDVTLPAGAKLLLSVEVVGKPKTVKWYKSGGQELTEKDGLKVTADAASGTYTATIPSVGMDDCGNYKVVMTNSRGVIASECNVVVKEALELVEGLHDATVKAGAGVSLQAIIKGRPTSIKWYRNGQLLVPEGMRVRMEDADDGSITLRVDESRKDDGGAYKLVLSDGLSPDIETQATLTVQLPKPKEPEDVAAKFTLPLMDHGEEEGGDITLKVAFKGLPFPEVAWLKDDVEIEKTSHFEIQTNTDGTSSLKIKGTAAADSGTFKCIVQNKAGSDKTNCTVFISKKKKVEVKPAGEPPQLIRKLGDREVEAGEEVRLEVRAIGDPVPTLTWLRNGEDITVGVETEQKDGEVISRLLLPPEGLTTATYTVKAVNAAGQAETSGKITVLPPKKPEELPPKFVIPVSVTTTVEGKDVVFDVKIRGKPTPTVKWYKNGQELSVSPKVEMDDMSDGRWRLKLKDVSTEDSATIKCVATNAVGSEESEAPLKVNPSKERKKAELEPYAPVFNVPLHDRKVPEGNPMKIECHVDAKPKADIAWLKDGEPLQASLRHEVMNLPDGKCKLTINDFGPADEGVYTCVATNTIGKAATAATLRREPKPEGEKEKQKEFAPRFIQLLADQRIKAGPDPLILECRVEACPIADIKWFKDGFPVKAKGRISATMDDNGLCSLRIENPTEEDAGGYRCVAANHLGSVNTAANITAAAPKAEAKKAGIGAQFTRGLTDTWADRGADIRVAVHVTGDPRPDVKWYKDGIPLRPSNRMEITYTDDGECTLVIKEATVSDEGLYRCFAENIHGSDKTAATVHIQAVREVRKVDMSSGEAPKFTRPLEDARAEKGAPVVLDCTVTGDPAPTLKWSKDGLILVEDHRTSIESLGGGSYRLRISELHAAQEGTYRVVASNSVGTATTKATVTVTTALGRVAPAASTAPNFTMPLRGTRAVEGRPFTLECKLDGEPLPDVQWFKDGERILPDDRVSIELKPDGTATLKIANATPDDEGTYRIMASNPSGSANQKAAVTVKRAFGAAIPTMNGRASDGKPPKLEIPMTGSRMKEGGQIRLVTKFSGSPTPVLKWFKDGDRVYPFGRVSLSKHEDGTEEMVIDDATSADAGCYRVVAENDHGTARTSAEVLVDVDKSRKKPGYDADSGKGRAPGFSIPLTVRRIMEGNTLSFECLPHGTPFPSIKWMKDGMDLASSGRFSTEALEDGRQRLTIKDATLADEGFYRCVASNDFGTASTKAELIVEPDLSKKRETTLVPEMLPELPGRPRFRRGLQSLTVNEGATAEFEVAIGGVPEADVKWFCNGTELFPSERLLMWKDDWGFNRLAVLNAQKSDEAEYVCEATNAHGMARTTCLLSVLKGRDWGHKEPTDGRPGLAPGYFRQLKNKHAFSGMPAIFDCLVAGSPNPDVEWFKDGKKILPSNNIRIEACGGGSHALIILRTSPEDAGEYSCVARNGIGVPATSKAVLDVTVPHLDKMHPDGYYDLTHLAITDYSYRKVPHASIPTPPDRGPFIAEVTGHYLTLSWIPTRRAPPRYPQVTYIIEMRELPDRDWVLLDYNIPEPVCKVRNLELGKSYQFRVRAENLYGISDPSPSSPPSQLMAPPKPVLDANRRPVHIRDPYELDAMSKRYGEQYAAAPWFAPRATDRTHCASGDTTEVVFYVYGFPDPDVTWTYRGHALDTTSPESRFKTNTYGGTECVLSVRGFTKEDAGQYQCLASNKYGDAQQNIFIELADRPNFIQKLDDKTVSSRRPLKLDVRVEGNPEPEVKWVKDWHPLAESSRVQMLADGPFLHSLIIHDPLLSDIGIYSAVATNVAGRATTSATVTIIAESLEPDVVELMRKKVHLKPKKVREFYEVEEEVTK